MTLIALLVALGVERLLSHLLHLRELRLFDRYFDRALARMNRQRPRWSHIWGAGVIVLPVLPVIAVALVLHTSGMLWNIPYFVFAVIVLLLSLGPRDLGEQVQDYCDTVRLGEVESSRVIAAALQERHGRDAPAREVHESVLVQANHRIFGVIFWFVLLGPVGAWLYRVADMFRRRAVAEAARSDPGWADASERVERLHGLLAWLPARLAAIGYALAGSFEDAVGAWREYAQRTVQPFFRATDDVLAAVGAAALARRVDADDDGHAGLTDVQSAMRLVTRTLFIWMAVVALMTLFGWAV